MIEFIRIKVKQKGDPEFSKLLYSGSPEVIKEHSMLGNNAVLFKALRKWYGYLNPYEAD